MRYEIDAFDDNTGGGVCQAEGEHPAFFPVAFFGCPRYTFSVLIFILKQKVLIHE